MSMFREMLWSLVLDKIFPISDSAVKTALLDDETFNPKGYTDDVRYSMVNAATPTLSTMFTDNTSILNFDEFSLFPTTQINSYLFKSCTSLVSISLPSSITKVYTGAFYNCSVLLSLNLGSATTIENSCCNGCTSLKTVTLSDNLKVIDKLTFHKCLSLDTINIPNKLTTIDSDAFNYCSSLPDITLPSTVTSIGNYAFANTSAFTTFTFPDAVPYLSSGVLERSGVKTITLPSNCTIIYGSAVQQCSNLQTINNFSDSTTITTIGDRAFNGCTKLANTGLPTNLESIGDSSFATCKNLVVTSLPSTLKSIDAWAFSDCSKLTITSIPANSDLTTLNSGCFKNTGITSITIPSNITKIDNEVFKGCNITSITLPDTLKFIGYEAFLNSPCEVNSLPASLETIEGDAFDTITNEFIELKSDSKVAIGRYSSTTDYAPFPNNTYVGLNTQDLIDEYEADTYWGAFKTDNGYKYVLNGNITFEDSNMKTACIDKTTTPIIDINNDDEIAYWEAVKCTNVATKFKGNTSILKFNEFKYFKNITSLTDSSFEGCSALTAITLPEDVTTIAAKSFYNCSTLETVTNIENITDFEEYAFAECASLKNVTLNSSVTTLKQRAFVGTTNLTTITELPETVTTLGEGCFGRSGITGTFNCKAKVTSIPKSCFALCSNLEAISVDAGVTSFGDYAFEQTKLTALPSGTTAITSIGNYCFRRGTSYTKPTPCMTGTLDLTVYPNLTSIGTHAFKEQGITEIKLPEGIKNLGTNIDDAEWPREGVFYDCYNLTTCNLPSSIEIIGTSCFAGTKFVLTQEAISALTNLKKVGLHAFGGSGTDSGAAIPAYNVYSIPASVTDLAHCSFGLTTAPVVELNNTTMVTLHPGYTGTVGGLTPFSITNTKVVEVPTEELVAAYKADSIWKEIAENVHEFMVKENIDFEDDAVKNVYIAHDVDTKGDGEISAGEAYLCTKFYDEEEGDDTTKTSWFKGNTSIKKFLKTYYFKNLGTGSLIPNDAFDDCTALEEFDWGYLSVCALGFNHVNGIKVMRFHTSPQCKYVVGRSHTSLEKIYIDSFEDWCNQHNSSAYGDTKAVFTYNHDVDLYVNDTLVEGEVTVPSTVTALGAAFCRIPKITKATVPSSVTELGACAFMGTNNSGVHTYTEVSFADASKVTYIGTEAFRYNDTTLPAGLLTNVTTMGQGAFEDCTSLPETITMNSLSNLSSYIFKNSKGLKYFTSTSANAGGYETFRGSEIITLTIPAVTSCGQSFAAGCTSLQTVNISSMTSVGIEAFKSCSALTTVTLCSTATTIERHAFDSTAVTLTSLPDTLTFIGPGAFKNCANVNITKLPASLEVLRNNSFYGTGITSIWIPHNTLIDIDKGSIDNFSPFPENTVILVNTSALKSAYEADETWAASMTTYGYTFAVKS